MRYPQTAYLLLISICHVTNRREFLDNHGLSTFLGRTAVHFPIAVRVCYRTLRRNARMGLVHPRPPGVSRCYQILPGRTSRESPWAARLPPATIILPVSTPELPWLSLPLPLGSIQLFQRRGRPNPNPNRFRDPFCAHPSECCAVLKCASHHVDSSPFTPVGLSASVVIRNPCRRPSCGLWTL